jgi:hypothetical protein
MLKSVSYFRKKLSYLPSTTSLQNWCVYSGDLNSMSLSGPPVGITGVGKVGLLLNFPMMGFDVSIAFRQRINVLMLGRRVERERGRITYLITLLTLISVDWF